MVMTTLSCRGKTAVPLVAMLMVCLFVRKLDHQNFLNFFKTTVIMSLLCSWTSFDKIMYLQLFNHVANMLTLKIGSFCQISIRPAVFQECHHQNTYALQICFILQHLTAKWPIFHIQVPPLLAEYSDFLANEITEIG